MIPIRNILKTPPPVLGSKSGDLFSKHWENTKEIVFSTFSCILARKYFFGKIRRTRDRRASVSCWRPLPGHIDSFVKTN